MPTNTNLDFLLNAISKSASFAEVDPKKVNHEQLSNLPSFVKVQEVAACCRISPEMVRHLIKEGELAAINISAKASSSRMHYRIAKESLLDYVKRRAAAK